LKTTLLPSYLCSKKGDRERGTARESDRERVRERGREGERERESV